MTRGLRAAVLLIASLVAPATSGTSGDTRVVDAARRADVAAVRALLKAGVDVNASRGDGATALHWAAHWDDADMAAALIRAGARVNAPNDLGATPLWLACENGSTAMVRTLLEAAASPNVALPSGETPLMTASRTGNPEVVTLLLERGADPNARELSRGQSPLMWAIAGGHAAVVERLLANGADMHARTDVRPRVVNTETTGFGHQVLIDVELGGYTPFLFAARVGDVASARLLIAAGADVNETAPDGTSVLVVAAHSGHGALGAVLLDAGANPNADGAGYTALHAAILRGDLGLVTALLAHGANPGAVLKKGTPARRASADYYLDGAMVGATPFWLAARFVEPAIMRLLAAHGADARFAMTDGTTALVAAIQGTRRAEPGTAFDDVANERRILEAVEVAAEQGVGVNAADADGNTALHVAATKRLNSVIAFLAARGADVGAKNRKGQTALAIVEPRAGARAGQADDARPVNSTAALLRSLGAAQ